MDLPNANFWAKKLPYQLRWADTVDWRPPYARLDIFQLLAMADARNIPSTPEQRCSIAWPKTGRNMQRLRSLLCAADAMLAPYHQWTVKDLRRCFKQRGLKIGSDRSKMKLIDMLVEADKELVFPLMNLPPELRLMVYKEYHGRPCSVEPWSRTLLDPPLAYVSKQVREESLEVKYRGLTLIMQVESRPRRRIALSNLSTSWLMAIVRRKVHRLCHLDFSSRELHTLTENYRIHIDLRKTDLLCGSVRSQNWSNARTTWEENPNEHDLVLFSHAAAEAMREAVCKVRKASWESTLRRVDIEQVAVAVHEALVIIYKERAH